MTFERLWFAGQGLWNVVAGPYPTVPHQRGEERFKPLSLQGEVSRGVVIDFGQALKLMRVTLQS